MDTSVILHVLHKYHIFAHSIAYSFPYCVVYFEYFLNLSCKQICALFMCTRTRNRFFLIWTFLWLFICAHIHTIRMFPPFIRKVPLIALSFIVFFMSSTAWCWGLFIFLGRVTFWAVSRHDKKSFFNELHCRMLQVHNYQTTSRLVRLVICQHCKAIPRVNQVFTQWCFCD